MSCGFDPSWSREPDCVLASLDGVLPCCKSTSSMIVNVWEILIEGTEVMTPPFSYFGCEASLVTWSWRDGTEVKPHLIKRMYWKVHASRGRKHYSIRIHTLWSENVPSVAGALVGLELGMGRQTQNKMSWSIKAWHHGNRTWDARVWINACGCATMISWPNQMAACLSFIEIILEPPGDRPLQKAWKSFLELCSTLEECLPTSLYVAPVQHVLVIPTRVKLYNSKATPLSSWLYPVNLGSGVLFEDLVCRKLFETPHGTLRHCCSESTEYHEIGWFCYSCTPVHDIKIGNEYLVWQDAKFA